jgi:tRNA pseudouridine32 synthase/23S rRNA pseudouridine746 synthase
MMPTVIHEDESLLAVDKPAGVLAVPGRGADKQDCLASQVQTRWPDARVVHRLDMATSGLMLFARGPELQRRLSIAFAARPVGRYSASTKCGASPRAPIGRCWPSTSKRRPRGWRCSR